VTIESAVFSLRRMLHTRKEAIALCIAFLWPMLYLFPYIFPFVPGALTIDNDFNHLYYGYKVYLLDELSRLHLPLWSPSESCGYPFYSNPFTQAFYPLNCVLAVWYKLAGGYSYSNHQVYTVFAVSIFSAGLFMWLRSVNVSLRAALAAGLVMSVSFKITEVLRFPNAMHAAAWMPFLLWGCVLALQKKTMIKGGLIFFGAAICLITAGYPYYAYYSIFLVGPFLVLLMFQTTRRAIGLTAAVDRPRFAATVAASGGAAVLVCLPYLSKMAQLLSQTIDRTGHDFAYSTEHVFDVVDTIGSLIYPPSAQIEGWYFFGFLALFVILLHLIHTVVVRDERAGSDRVFFLTVAIWFAGITLITYGRNSALFWVLWDYFPGFSSLRMWGRLNIILVPILALVLGRSYMFMESFLFGGIGSAAPAKRAKTLLGLVLVYGLVLLCQLVLFHYRLFDPYWASYYLVLHMYHSRRLYELFPIVAGLVSFGLFVAAGRFSGVRDVVVRNAPRLALIVFVGVVAVDLGVIGRSCWTFRMRPPTGRYILHIDAVTRQAFTTPRANFAYAVISHDERFNVGLLYNWYFVRYTEFIQSHRNRHPKNPTIIQESDLDSLLGITTGQRLYFTESIRDTSVSEFLARSRSFEASTGFSAQIESYTGDRLSLIATNRASGFLSFIDNWDPDWTVLIDGKKGTIELLFGTFKAVRIPAGRTVVEFVYRPFGKLL
jgi:hypothetical protein